MVFISSNTDVLRVRDVPVFAGPIGAVVSAGLVGLVVALGRSGQTVALIATLCAAVFMLFALLGCLRLHHCVFDRGSRSLIVNTVCLTGRSQATYRVGDRAYAELVIRDDGDGDGCDVYQATFVTSEETVPLGEASSQLRGSSRVVMAVNAWLAHPAEAA